MPTHADPGPSPADAPRATSVPPAGPFLVRDRQPDDGGRRRFRSVRLARPHHGVRATAGADDLLSRCRAAALVLDDDVAFGHVTALRLLGVEVPWRLDADQRIHVVSPTRRDRPQRRDVVAHHSTHAVLTTTVDGLRVTTPAQTWLHLARGLRTEDLVVLADAMTRRKDPATSLAALAEAVGAGRRVKGVVACREALELARPGTDSSMETRTRLLLVEAGLPCPEVNRAVRDAAGRFVALPDLSYPALRLAIEYDGDVHRTDAATWRRDVRRTQALEELGWRVLVVTADDVIRFPERLVARVDRARRDAVGRVLPAR